MKMNAAGRFKKTDIENENGKIIEFREGLYTYKELKQELKQEFKIEIEWNTQEQQEKVYGYYCSRPLRGCIPLFDIWEHLHTDLL